LVYVVSSVAVIFNRNAVEQLYYQGHKDAIISLDLDSAGRTAASGDLSEYPEVHVWDAKTGRAIKKFERLHRQGISSVSFSANSEYLISLGQDANNSIVVCHSPSRQWTDGHHICSTSVSSAKMLWCLHSSSSAMYPIVVGGAQGNVFFFRVLRGSADRVRGIYGKRFKIQPLLCAVDGVVTGSGLGVANLPHTEGGAPGSAVTAPHAMNVMLCGTVNGYIYLFSETKVINRIAAHEAPVNAVCPANKNFLSAGKDGKVKLWTSDMKILFVFNISGYIPRPYHVSCHAVSCNRQGTSFAVGMRSGEIYESSVQSHSYAALAEAHSRGEVHALDVNPANPDEYATAGDDGVVMVWSVRRRYCLRKVRVEAASRAIAYSPDGQHICVGFGAGDGNTIASKDGMRNI
jgi:WD40 repeat protein